MGRVAHREWGRDLPYCREALPGSLNPLPVVIFGLAVRLQRKEE